MTVTSSSVEGERKRGGRRRAGGWPLQDGKEGEAASKVKLKGGG